MLRFAFAIALGVAALALVSGTRADDKKDEKKLEVPADVRTVLDKVRDAYKDTKSLKLAGEITGEFDMNGEQLTHRAEFTALFQSPTTFRHQLREESGRRPDGICRAR